MEERYLKIQLLKHMERNNMIRLEKVNKYFNRHKKNEIHVINDVSLDLPTSGLVALLGESGSGKTTMLNAMGGLDSVKSGNIYIDGNRITRKTSYKIDKISIKNSKIGRAVSYILRARIVLDVPALPEGRGENY